MDEFLKSVGSSWNNVKLNFVNFQNYVLTLLHSNAWLSEMLLVSVLPQFLANFYKLRKKSKLFPMVNWQHVTDAVDGT